MDTNIPKRVSFDNNDNVLNILKGALTCRRKEHEIVLVKGILPDLHGYCVKIDVNYCIECNKYFLKYEKYKEYRKKYGIILGNTPILYNNLEIDAYLSNGVGHESILHMLGYSIGNKSNLTDIERRRILGNVMDRNIVAKHRVIEMIQSHTGVSKYGNRYKPEFQCWYDDIRWVREYQVNALKEYIEYPDKYR